MSSALAYILLTLALILPVAGAFILRFLSQRLTLPQFYGSALLIFGIAIASVLTLARSNITNLQVGNLSLLLPIEGSLDAVNLPPATIVPGLTLEQSSETAISGSQATTETATLASIPTTETAV